MVAPSFPRLRDRALLALLLPVVGPLIEKQYGATPAAADRAETLILDSPPASRTSASHAHLRGEAASEIGRASCRERV